MATDSLLLSIGECVRDERVRVGMTLEQLAQGAGLSTPHLSRIESGDRQPSVAALIAISRVLGVSVSVLLGEGQKGPALSVHTGSTSTHRVNGLAISGCSGFPGSSILEALKVVIDPNRVASQFASHRGEEWIFVLSGTLRLECDGEVHLLEPGSSAHFDAELPHRLGAEDTEAEVLIVAADSLKELYKHPLFTSKSLVH